MAEEVQSERRVIRVNQSIVASGEPRVRTVRARKVADYPQVPRAWLDVAQKLASPVRIGPPICDELIAFVQHVFTEEEASLVRHLGMFRGRGAVEIARAERRHPADVELALERMAMGLRTIACDGPPEKRRYRLLPIVPGMFEMVLISCTPDTLSDWHRRFIELFETLYETGYMLDYAYAGRPTPAIRYLPVGKAIEAHPMALPSDKLEVVLDRFDMFGVGQCQCRLTMQMLGRGCGRPLGNCTVIGQWASRGIEDGWLRKVSKQEVLDIKREAESHGLATWMMNVDSKRGQCSCSCCGCCCHAMRGVTEFNAPGALAPPHFRPQMDETKCTFCGKCVKICPMGAIVIEEEANGEPGGTACEQAVAHRGEPATRRKVYRRRVERCVGCGLCAVACDRQHALTMEPVPDYQMPYRSWYSFIAHAVPGALWTSFKVWRERRG